MIAPGIFAAATRRARGAGRLLFAGTLFASAFGAGAPAVADTATLTASYGITIAGITIGRVDVTGRFTDDGYTTSIDGATSGISRFVSDARASLAGSGRISGSRIVPGTYNLDTSEGDFATRVRMSMRGGAVVQVDANPSLIEAADRVPLTGSHKSNVVDPVGAFFVARDRPGPLDGRRICGRTVKIFDGWQRFDVRLSYSETKAVSGGYTGDVVVCSARYVPIAGHRPSRESVEFMANNRRLEIWMAPIEGTNLLAPVRILIGTKIGDLVVAAQRFETSGATRQARTN
jgi:hypothetical protein